MFLIDLQPSAHRVICPCNSLRTKVAVVYFIIHSGHTLVFIFLEIYFNCFAVCWSHCDIPWQLPENDKAVEDGTQQKEEERRWRTSHHFSQYTLFHLHIFFNNLTNKRRWSSLRADFACFCSDSRKLTPGGFQWFFCNSMCYFLKNFFYS